MAMVAIGSGLGSEKVEEIVTKLKDNDGQLPLENLIISSGVLQSQVQAGDYPWQIYTGQSDQKTWIALRPVWHKNYDAAVEALTGFTGTSASTGSSAYALSSAAGYTDEQQMALMGADPTSDPNAFIAAHPHAQQNAIEAFMELTEELQLSVMKAGSMAGQDQTTVLLERCQTVKGGGSLPEAGKVSEEAQESIPKPRMSVQEAEALAAKQQSEMQSMDWLCPGCFSVQYQKYVQCRKCGTRNPAYEVNPVVSHQVEQFLISYAFEKQAADNFRSMAPDLQQLVMSKGSLAGVRDPTAVLIGRMRDARSGMLNLGATNALPGDWFCPSCNDHQFQKNTVCRSCGTPNPNGSVGHQNHQSAVHQEIGMGMGMGKGKGKGGGGHNKDGSHSGSRALPGDWYCPGCNDLQFARNKQCRKCGTPNPSLGQRQGMLQNGGQMGQRQDRKSVV